MHHVKVHRMPLLRRLEELWQPVLSQHLAHHSPTETPIDEARADFKVERVVLVVRSLGELLLQECRRGLLSGSYGGGREDRLNRGGVGLPVADCER